MLKLKTLLQKIKLTDEMLSILKEGDSKLHALFKVSLISILSVTSLCHAIF